MKNVKLALAMAAALAASSAAQATNEITTDTSVTAYIAAGLSLSATALNLGTLVAPTNGTGPSRVQIACDGDVTYSTNGAPGGGSDSDDTTNSGAGKNPQPSVGSIIIGGEPNYAVTVLAKPATGNNTDNVDFSVEVSLKSDCTTNASGHYQLDGNGDLELILSGELSVTQPSDPTLSPDSTIGGDTVSTNINITVSYR
jgi:hypothetical protein